MAKETYRGEFRKRLYFLTLKLIEFIDHLPKDNVSQRIGDELFTCGTNIISNYMEAIRLPKTTDEETKFSSLIEVSN